MAASGGYFALTHSLFRQDLLNGFNLLLPYRARQLHLE